MKLSPARIAAFDILLRVERDRQFTSTLLPEYESELSAVDRGLCHELVLGVLRRQLLLDRYIDLLTSRKLDLEVRVALRLGLFQLYFLERVPAHAAVNESVGLALRARKGSARGLVNAVLRRSAAARPKLDFADELERVSIETSHPMWLLEHWVSEFGFGEAERLANANNQAPSLSFRRTPAGLDLELSEKYRRSQYVSGCLFPDSMTPELRRFTDESKIYFQDEASQLIASAVQVRDGQKFLDVCASPGGKTTAIVTNTIVSGSGAANVLTVAGDLTERRVKLLAETCRKQSLANVNVLRYDASQELPFADHTFDAVLVDAPCTGTGTIRHNPEIRYFIQPSDFGRMQQSQLAILSNAARTVCRGGRLYYSTCSLERAEDEDVCRRFLSGTSSFRLATPSVPERFHTNEGFARTFPQRDDADGFFLATFELI